MNEFFAFLSLFIALAIMFVFAYWIDNIHLKLIIKQYNKTHTNDIKDYKKSSIKDMNKQYLEWYISMFARDSDGISLWDRFREWSDNSEK